MKKLAIAAILPLVALTSCNKEQAQEVVESNTWNTNIDNTWSEVSTWEVLNSEISASTMTASWVEIKNFSQKYLLPNGEESVLAWKIQLENWIIKSIEFPWLDLNSWYPQATFAKAIWEKIIWKEIKWLQVDAVSWASLTTTAFNEYLKNL